MPTKKLKTALWIIAATSSAVAIFSLFANYYMNKGGEPYFPLYRFFWSNEHLWLPLQFFSGAVSLGSLLTLFGFRVSQNRRSKTLPTWSKLHKFNQMRALALVIAGIPGLVLAPFGMGALLMLLPDSTIRNTIGGLLVMVSVGLLIPSAMAMFTLLVLNVINWSRSSIDPESPTPKTQLIQIILSVIAAAMPAIAYFSMINHAFDECTEDCSAFNVPEIIPATVVYATIWLALGIIWLRTKQTKTRSSKPTA